VPEVADRDEEWPVVSTALPYDGDGWIVRLRADRIQRPGHPEEEPFKRLVVEHPGAVVVLAVDHDERVLCLRQYRHAVGQNLVQLPAGLCDVEGEDPVDVGRRELAEEAGFEAAEWTHLISTYSSPGILEELVHYFVARSLTEVGRGDFEPRHEEAEMETIWVPVAELRAAVLAGRVHDAHLTIALLGAHARNLVGPSSG
jgi:ADP-ribose pyrophosphatase